MLAPSFSGFESLSPYPLWRHMMPMRRLTIITFFMLPFFLFAFFSALEVTTHSAEYNAIFWKEVPTNNFKLGSFVYQIFSFFTIKKEMIYFPLESNRQLPIWLISHFLHFFENPLLTSKCTLVIVNSKYLLKLNCQFLLSNHNFY